MIQEGKDAVKLVCSPTQWRIVELRLSGLSREEIAREMGVTPATIRSQITRLREKRLPRVGRDLICSL